VSDVHSKDRAGRGAGDVPEQGVDGPEKVDSPTDIRPGGWWQVLKRGWRESGADNVPILAGGVAFFGFLALFPALIAGLTVYGLVADPAQAAAQIRRVTDGLPGSAQALITDQLTAAIQVDQKALTFGFVVALLVALWSVSSGIGNLIKAVNIAYDQHEARGFTKLRAVSLLLALAAIVFVLATLALVAVVPALIDGLGLGLAGRIAAEVVRWALLIALVVFSLAVIYRIAPNRPTPHWRWVSPGALAAATLWVLGNVGFSLYVNYFSNYNKTYGALAGVIVLMLWIYLTSFIVLFGAEINAESERQAARRNAALAG
jgi:membrane protein